MRLAAPWFCLALAASGCVAPAANGGSDGGMLDGTVGDNANDDLTMSDPGDGSVATKVDMVVPLLTPSDPVVLTVEPDGSNDASNLLAAINGAKTSVHMEMYLLTSPTYITALINRAKVIEVSVVLNQSFPSGTPAAQTNNATFTQLQMNGVNVHWAPTNTGFNNVMHAKTIVIDPGAAGAQAWIMTMNLDTTALKSNREYIVKDTNADDIAEAEAIFQADYNTMNYTAVGKLIVSPSLQNNSHAALLKLIQSAKTSIDIEMEEFNTSGLELDLANALLSRAQAGVMVRLVIEDSNDPAQASAVMALQSSGGHVVGYSKTLDIHAKAIVVDNASAFVGSENLSGASLGYNREIGVYFTTASEIAKLTKTISDDFAGGGPYSSN